MRCTGAQNPRHHHFVLAPAGRRHFPALQQSPSEGDDEHFDMRSTAEVHQLLWAPAPRAGLASTSLHVRRPRRSPFAFVAVVVPPGCVLGPTSCSFAGVWRHGSSPASCDTDLHAEADSLPGRWYRCISSLKSCSGGRAAGERRLHRSLSRLTSRNLLRCRSEPEAGHSWAAIKSCWLRRPGRSASICKPGC